MSIDLFPYIYWLATHTIDKVCSSENVNKPNFVLQIIDPPLQCFPHMPYAKQVFILFSLTKGQKMNTKVGLHHLPTHHLLPTYPPQTFRALSNYLGN